MPPTVLPALQPRLPLAHNPRCGPPADQPCAPAMSWIRNGDPPDGGSSGRHVARSPGRHRAPARRPAGVWLVPDSKRCPPGPDVSTSSTHQGARSAAIEQHSSDRLSDRTRIMDHPHPAPAFASCTRLRLAKNRPPRDDLSVDAGYVTDWVENASTVSILVSRRPALELAADDRSFSARAGSG